MSQNDMRELSKMFQIQFYVFYNKSCVYSQVGSANQDRRIILAFTTNNWSFASVVYGQIVKGTKVWV